MKPNLDRFTRSGATSKYNWVTSIESDEIPTTHLYGPIRPVECQRPASGLTTAGGALVTLKARVVLPPSAANLSR